MAKASEAFSKHYQSLTTDELLRLAVNRQELGEEAMVALDEELHTRGLSEDAVLEYKSWMLAQPGEPESPDLAPQGVEQEATTPAELPSDWFDTRADAGPRTRASARPKGVTLAAFLFWVGGLITFAAGVAILVLNSRRVSVVSAVGLSAAAWGAASFVCGFGLWRLRLWARITAEILCWIVLLSRVAMVTLDAIARLRGADINPGSVLLDVSACVFAVLWVVYFGRADVRKAFAAAATSADVKAQ